MDMSHLIRLLPTLETIAEQFTAAGWICRTHISAERQAYRSIRLFTGTQELYSDILYVLRPGTEAFPADQYAYVCTFPLEGEANHILCPEQNTDEILDKLMELFAQYQYQEGLIDQLTYRGSGLQELCELGAELLGNPVFIHDDWFIMIGMSQKASEIIVPEYMASSTVGFIPSVILDDFKYDSDYLETYSHPNAQIWSAPGAVDSLYVNLWDGTIYRGRLLVLAHHRYFRKSDYLLAEVLAQRAILMLQRAQPGQPRQYRSMDDIVFALLEGTAADPADLSHLLNMLDWNRSHRFLCVRLKNQQENATTMMEHVLHSDLFRTFPGSYIMLMEHEQCLVIDLDQTGLQLPQLRHQLAPLCRDYCLYAGISSPVSGIQELSLAYCQAGISLDYAFRSHSEKWIIDFSQCVLDHVFSNLPAPLAARHLISPELRVLIAHDKEKGTQYFETLREFLLQERDIPRTAEALIIHRTTLLYRLKKIHALVRLNLDDAWQRLYLTLSLWLLEQEAHL